MEKVIIRRGDTEKVLKLVTNEYQTANSICEKANGVPYSNYISYVRNLEKLYIDGYIEKMEVKGKKNNTIFWRKKIE